MTNEEMESLLIYKGKSECRRILKREMLDHPKLKAGIYTIVLEKM